MQTKLMILVLLIGLGYSVKGNDISRIVEDNDNYESLCETLDLDCVRDFLTKTGTCNPSSYEDGDLVNLDELVYYIPSIDLAVVCTNYNVTFTGYKILSLYKNKQTNRIVLTIGFKGIRMESPRTYFIVSRVGQPSVTITDYIDVTFTVILTAVFPAGDFISMKDVIVTSHQINKNPSYDMGKNVTDSEIKVIQEAYGTFLENIATSTKEIFLTNQYYFFHQFVTAYIADCGYRYDGKIINF